MRKLILDEVHQSRRITAGLDVNLVQQLHHQSGKAFARTVQLRGMRGDGFTSVNMNLKVPSSPPHHHRRRSLPCGRFVFKHDKTRGVVTEFDVVLEFFVPEFRSKDVGILL